MAVTKVKEAFDFETLRTLGYRYSMMEGGYISPDGATIVIDNRKPYIREVMQFQPNVEKEHSKNIEKLREFNALEV